MASGRCCGRCTYAIGGYHTTAISKTMPRADCPPGAWLARCPARESAPGCRRGGEASPASCGASPHQQSGYGRVHCPVRSSKATGRLHASGDSSGISQEPARGAAWPPPPAPPRCRLVASAVSRQARCSLNAGARLRPGNPGSALPILWCFSAISVPNMAVDVSLGVIPICRQTILEARGPVNRSAPAPWCEFHGVGLLLLRRCRPDWDLSVSGSGRHALSCPPYHPASPCRPPVRTTVSGGKQKPRTSKRPGARRSRSVKVSRWYGKPPGTER